MSVITESLVQPGKHLLFFQIPVQWMRDGYAHNKTLTTTSEIEVAVLGESIMLTAMGVPSFLLLPGFLALTTVAFLWNRIPSKIRRDKFSLVVSSPDFWLVAISLSVASAFLYPQITKGMRQQRDYLNGYGLTDVVYVWMGSIVSGLIIFITLTFCNYLRRCRVQAYEFSEADTPIQFLFKLGRRNLGPYLERGKFSGGTTPEFVFFVETVGEGETWVAPAISVTWNREIDSLKQQSDFEQQLVENGNTKKLSRLLAENAKRNVLRVRWKAAGEITRLERVRNEDITREGQKGLL
jgi:hypothetical protein